MNLTSRNGQLAEFLVRHAGFGRTAISRLHRATLYALGVGGATHDPRVNGERLVIERLLGRDSVTVFDVGANRGDYAQLVLEVLGPHAAIHCFEPAPDSFAVLEERLGGRVALHPCALGAERGEAVLYADEELSLFASLHPLRGRRPTTSRTVILETVEAICAAHAVQRIDLLKLDIEGGELDALRGAEPLLRQGRIDLIQFEFGQNSLEARTYMRDFYDLLGATHHLYRVTPRGPVALGDYRLALEIFESATNYAAVPRRFDRDS